jgi:hypothetical protein
MSKKVYSASEVLEVTSRGMTDFQIKNFVINAQITPYKQLTQACLEIDIRQESLERLKFEIEKNTIKLKILEKKRETEQDELFQLQMDLEIHNIKDKIKAGEKEIIRSSKEMQSFKDVLDFFNENYDIQEMLSMKDTLDIDYWVKRLARQATMDLIGQGRISTGNMTAMLDMPPEIFQICVQETFKLANELSKVVPMPALAGPGQEEFLLKFGNEEQKEELNLLKVEKNVVDKV